MCHKDAGGDQPAALKGFRTWLGGEQQNHLQLAMVQVGFVPRGADLHHSPRAGQFLSHSIFPPAKCLIFSLLCLHMLSVMS